jgi:uncharacterized protein
VIERQTFPIITARSPNMHFEIYRRRLHRAPWRWRLRAANGEIIASGQGYRRRIDCVNAIDLIRKQAGNAELETLP